MDPIAVHILHTGGHFPRLLGEYLRNQGAPVEAFEVPADCPEGVDHPAECLPAQLGQAEVVIAIGLPAPLLTALPELLAGTGCRALVVPVEDQRTLRPGPAMQLERACQAAGLECAIPVPFCAYVPSTATMIRFCEQYAVGRPRLEMTAEGDTVTEVRCLRGSPCGLTHWVAEQLRGAPVGEVEHRAKVLHHGRPCLASMALVPETGDTLMHTSVDILMRAVSKALRQAQGHSLICRQP
jgi:hypothetical protein